MPKDRRSAKSSSNIPTLVSLRVGRRETKVERAITTTLNQTQAPLRRRIHTTPCMFAYEFMRWVGTHPFGFLNISNY